MFRHVYLKNKPKRFRKPKIRSYFAALGANVKPLPARVVQSPDITRLELRVPAQYLSAHTLPRHRSNAVEDEKMDDTPIWTTMFTITSNSLISNQNIFISDEIMQRCKSQTDLLKHIVRGAAYRTPYHSDYYFPTLLFSIPNSVWNDFVAKLPNQDVANNLQLTEHRHLWSAYQYASAKDSSINQYRSDAIGKYHFLASIIANLGPDQPVNYCHHVFDWFHGENLTKDIKIDIDLNFPAIFQQIDEGKEPAKLLTNRLPYLTPSFLNKFSQCPLWHDVHAVGLNLVLPHATNRFGHINKTHLDGLIADLPSSKNEPEQFANMVQDARKMLTDRFDKKFSASFFYDVRHNFGHFDGHLIELSDYIKALSNDLIFPEIIRQLGATSQLCKNLKSLHIILKNIVPLVAEIMRSINSNQLIKLQQRWHRNVTQIAAHKPPSPFELKWHALFEQQIINNVTFTCLIDNEQLKQEGDDMRHCVSGYGDRCMSGTSHIVSVTTQSGERATLELCNRDNKIIIEQNRGVKNTIPSAEIKLATDKLIDDLNNKIIAINSKRGSLNNMDKTSANTIYPYSFQDDATQEAIYQAYKEAKVLPPCLVADNYKDMLKKNNIVDLIQKADILTRKDNLNRQLL